jgi:UDPglucose--hexose-1-phosphate uridylyltransferase
MTSKVRFQTVRSESRFLDPRKSFEPTVEPFEVRTDPLTAKTGRCAHFGAMKPQQLRFEDYEKPEIKGFCPFCLQNREAYTPKFVPSLVPEGRLKKREACLLPNLFPYDVHSGILVMTDDHVVPLNGFSEGRLRDAVSLGTEFLRRTKAADPSLPYHLMTWNYMPPSGGGLVHPHQQYFATEFPGNGFVEELKASERFYGIQGVDYWSELVAEEQYLTERYIGRIGNSHWIASFVSLGLLGEVMAVFPHVFSLRDFRESHIEDLVLGFQKIFSYFAAIGVSSFNAALVFGPEGQNYYSAHLRILPRSFLNMRDYASDVSFFQTLLLEPVTLVLPEELCKDLRPYFAA